MEQDCRVPTSDLDLAFLLADQASEISLPAYRERQFEIRTKADGSPVTSVDTTVEVRLRELIAAERPGDAVVGEEFGGEQREDRCWYLDPIDGTHGLVAGTDRWCTLIALVEDGEVIVGVADLPTYDSRFWAARGHGAFADRRRMRVSSTDRLAGATVCDDYRRHIENQIDGHPLVRLAQRAGSVHPHEGHSMLVVGDGRGEIALGTGGGPWDYAPFMVIVAEAGGRVTNLNGESRFDTGTLLATNGRVHDEALAILR
jgi:histidinol-phosphatase